MVLPLVLVLLLASVASSSSSSEAVSKYSNQDSFPGELSSAVYSVFASPVSNSQYSTKALWLPRRRRRRRSMVEELPQFPGAGNVSGIHAWQVKLGVRGRGGREEQG